MKKLARTYLILLMVLGGITVTTVLADTVTITSYPYVIQDSSNNQRLNIVSSGNVGISDTSPSKKLVVVGSDSGSLANYLRVANTGAANGGGAGIEFVETYGNPENLVSTPSGAILGKGVNASPQQGQLVFQTNNVGNLQTQMILDYNGNLGVGDTVAATNKLDVNGNLGVGSYAGSSSAPTNGAIISGNVGIGTAFPTNKLDVNGNLAVGSYAGSSSAPTNGAIISGNVYIGTTNSIGSGTLSVAGRIAAKPNADTTALVLGNGPSNGLYGIGVSGSASPDLLFSNNAGIERMRLTDSGNVGIGTTSPQQLLDVNGNIRLTGNIISPNDICIGSC